MIAESVVWLGDVGNRDLACVGGTNASLGELIHALVPEGISVPDGFALTASAYRNFIAVNGMETKMAVLLAQRAAGTRTWSQAGAAMRALVMEGTFPVETASHIGDFYRALGVRAGTDNPAVSVRSSTTGEDLSDASLAGREESCLNVRGKEALLAACQRCYASLFMDWAISRRDLMHLDQMDVALSVGVQLMVRADVGSSGVMLSLDIDAGLPRVAVISANWGLGESVLQGIVNPDKYRVFTPLPSTGESLPVIEKTKGSKVCKLVCAPHGADTFMVNTTATERDIFVLDDHDIMQLGRWAVQIGRHYGRPMNMEWAKDGITGELFIMQARPEPVPAR